MTQVECVVIGTILGFLLSIVADHVKRYRDSLDRRRLGKYLASAVVEEIEQGVVRCGYLVSLASEKKVSFSRVYTGLWDSAKNDLSELLLELKAPEALTLVHRVYRSFDLINFNMDRGFYGPAAGFAQHYLGEMNDTLQQLRQRVLALTSPEKPSCSDGFTKIWTAYSRMQ